ncbi:MAG: 30S ribosomal protein S12 methylthiotransferase RimO [Planctomycetes bacterium]|nr:30S ribosomal protein S12 methylthiotransferase RimO [Planctomycetota bacterium]
MLRIPATSHTVPNPAVVSLVHLGCARNQIDSELILGRLADAGLIVSGDPEQADTVVLNTCSFIGPARAESEGQIRRLCAKKKRGELERVVVAGCLVQRFQRELQKRFPLVDIFAEISDGKALAKAISDLSQGRSVPRYLDNGGLREATRDESRLLSTPGSYAYLRISHGCDHTCSFCAIPAIRGPHRSKRPDDVLSEACELIGAGVKELVIVAEDSTAWGRDMGLELDALVRALADLDGEHKVRVMYAYPNRFPWGLADLLANHPRVARYLDIPVQHIATPVLRAMRRAGSGDQVRKLLDRLRAQVPGITLRTTVLVGFPGETEQDIDELCAFIREYRLARLGAFMYSPEEGTPGFDLPGRVSDKEAKARQRAVLAARDEVLRAEQGALVGTEFDVVIDESSPSRGVPNVARGDMDAPEVDLVTLVSGRKLAVGKRVRVKVEGLDAESNLIAKAVRG